MLSIYIRTINPPIDFSVWLRNDAIQWSDATGSGLYNISKEKVARLVGLAREAEAEIKSSERKPWKAGSRAFLMFAGERAWDVPYHAEGLHSFSQLQKFVEEVKTIVSNQSNSNLNSTRQP